MTAFEALGMAFREQATSDFGIDAHVELIESEQPTGQLIGIQLKSGPSYLGEKYDAGFIFRSDRQHVEYWQNHALPVLICLCNVEASEIYWQQVNPETSIPTGKSFKFNVPKNQLVDRASLKIFRDILTPVVPASRYTIFETDDTSHNAAKRYAFAAVLNGSATKAEIAAIVRQMTTEGAKRRYHRNDLVEGRWGHSDAHVVDIFIYPSAEDHARRNHICRSRWIRDDLEEQFRPMAFRGENVGDGIIVDWSSNYKSLADFVSTNTLSKEEYFARAFPTIEEVKNLLTIVGHSLDALSEQELAESDFLTAHSGQLIRLDEIYSDVSALAFAPFECRDVDEKFQSFVSHMHNIYIFFSERGIKAWDEQGRLDQALQQRRYAREALQHLEYEISKVR